MKIGQSTVLVLVSLAIIGGCNTAKQPQAAAPPVVFTSFYPLTYFAQRIGGPSIRVVCPVPADADPDQWMPDAAAIGAYQQADLIAVNGATYERWLGKVSLPSSKVVDTSRPLADRLLRYEGAVTHSHGPGGMHSHEGVDGHTWLDPASAMVQADEIRHAIEKLLPDAGGDLRARADSLRADLGKLDAALREASKLLDYRPLLASHPAYNYLARHYGWNMINVSLDPEKTPDAETLAQIGRVVEDKHAQSILWEAPPQPAIAELLRTKFGLASVVFSPCETPPAGKDYLAVMRENIERLRAALVEHKR